MNRSLPACVGFVGMIATSVAYADTAPLEIKSIKLGVTTVADVKRLYPGADEHDASIFISRLGEVNAKCGYFTTSSVEKMRANIACMNEMSTPSAMEPLLLGGKYQIDLMLHPLSDGVINDAYASFRKDGYTFIKAAMIAKYGQPTLVSSETARNLAGAALQSEELRWVRSDGTIEMSELCGKVDQSCINMSTSKYVKEKASDMQKDAKTAAGKL